MMNREVHPKPRRVLGSVAVAAIVVCMTLPFLLANDPTESILKSYIVRAADQGSFTLSEPLKLLDEPPILLRKGTVSVGQPNGAAPLGSLALAKLVESGRGVLILKDAEIEIGGSELDAAVGASAAQTVIAPLAKALSDSNFRALLIENSKVHFASGGTRQLEFENVRIRLRPSAGDRLIAKGKFEYLGRDVEFDTTITASKADRKAGQLPIRATLKGGKIFSASFHGKLALGSGGRLMAETTSISVDDVPIMARWLGLAWPSELKLATFKASGSMEWAGQILNFPNGRFQLDTNKAAGSLLLNTKASRPLIDGTLAFSDLDVGTLIDLGELQGTSLFASTVRKTADWLPAKFREILSELNLPILRQMDLDLRVSAARTVAGQMSLGRTAAALSIHDGSVLLDLAEMELASGGHGNFQVSIDTSKHFARCGVRGSLKKVLAEDLTPLLFPHPVIKGPVDITLDLNGDWINADTFVRTLDGTVAVTMPSGVKLAADLPSLVDSIGLNEPARNGWGAATEGRTNMDSMTAEVVFKDGVASINELTAKSAGQDKVAVTGTFSIHQKQLDLNVFPRTDPNSSEIPSVLRINGHWDSPQLSKIRFPDNAQSPAFPIPSNSSPALGAPSDQSAQRG